MRRSSNPLIAAACLLALVPLTVAAGVNFESRPTDRPIHIDGNPADWDGLPTAYLEGSLRAISITHDDDNIYIMYRFGDERPAQPRD